MAKDRSSTPKQAAPAIPLPAVNPVAAAQGDGEVAPKWEPIPLDFDENEVLAQGNPAGSTVAPQAAPDAAPQESAPADPSVEPPNAAKNGADVSLMKNPLQGVERDAALQAEIDKAHKGPSILGDLAKAIPNGIGKAIKATADLGLSMLPDSVRKSVEAGAIDKNASGKGWLDRGIEESQPQTIAGSIASSVSQNLVGMLGGSKFLKLSGALQGTGKAAIAAHGLAMGAIGDGVVFDPLEKRLSNLIEEHTSLGNPITEYLAADSNDSQAEGRLKNVIEGSVLGVAADVLFAAVRGTRRVIAARATGGDKAATKVEAEVADEIETITSQGKIGKITPLPGVEDAAGKVAVESKELMNPEAKAAFQEAILKEDSYTSIPVGIDFNFKHFEGPDRIPQIMNAMSEAAAPVLEKAKGGVRSLAETKRRALAMADTLGEDGDNFLAKLAGASKTAQEMDAILIKGKMLVGGIASKINDAAVAMKNGVGNQADLDLYTDLFAEAQSHLKGVQTGAARTTSAGRIKWSPEMLNDVIAAGGDPGILGRVLKPQTFGTKALKIFNAIRVNNLLWSPVTLSKNLIGGLYTTTLNPTFRMVGGFAKRDPVAMKDGLNTFIGLYSHARDSFVMARKALNMEAPILASRDSVAESAKEAKATLGDWWGGKLLRLPTTMMMATDEFVKQINYRAAIHQDALTEGLKKGLKGNELADHVSNAIDDSFNADGSAMLSGPRQEMALERAKRATFTQEYTGPIMKGIDRTAREAPIINTIIPFRKAPYNILKSAAQHLPAIRGLSSELRADIVAGGSRAAEAEGRMACGSAFMVAATMWAANNRLSGARPRDATMANGWQPYSVLIGGKWRSYQGIEPLGTLLGTAADYMQISQMAEARDTDELGSTIAVAMASNLTNKTYLQGISDIVSVMDSDDPNKWEGYARRFTAGSLMPNIVNQAAKEIDPAVHQAWDLKEEMMKRTPGLSQELPPLRNPLGQPVDHSEGVFMVSPFALSKQTPEVVADEMQRLSLREGQFTVPDRKIGNVELTHKQHDRLSELAGEGLVDALKGLVKSDEYKNLGDSVGIYRSAKRELFDNVIGKYRKAAQKRLLNEDAGLLEAVNADKLNKGAVRSNQPNLISSILQPPK